MLPTYLFALGQEQNSLENSNNDIDKEGKKDYDGVTYKEGQTDYGDGSDYYFHFIGEKEQYHDQWSGTLGYTEKSSLGDLKSEKVQFLIKPSDKSVVGWEA